MFPTTQISAITALRGPDAQRSWARVAEAYWRPVYKHLRLKWKKAAAEAEDLTQSFFETAFEREFLGDWDPSRARFRTFLKTCVDRFAQKHADRESAAKRGGGAVLLDIAGAEHELATESTPDIETLFEREWSRSVFALSLARLRTNQAGTTRLAVFVAYDLAEPEARPTYEVLAARFELPATTITNQLAVMRRALRNEVVATLKELTADDAELREETRTLLGEP